MTSPQNWDFLTPSFPLSPYVIFGAVTLPVPVAQSYLARAVASQQKFVDIHFNNLGDQVRPSHSMSSSP